MPTIEEDDTGGLLIRAARAQDMPAVAAIFSHYVNDTVITFELLAPSIEDWCAKLHDLELSGWPFLVATIASHVVGYAYVTAWRPKPAYRHTVENTIYLAPEHTGRGYGQRLLKELLTVARAADARQVLAVIADTDTGTPPSLALHRRAGFENVGRLRNVGFKHGLWIDTVLMQVSLDAHRDP